MATKADKEFMVNQPCDSVNELETHGITVDYLIKKLKRELNAKETKIIKIKGAVKQEDLPKGFKVIGTSGHLSYDKEGAEVFGDGETVIRYDPQALGIRQKGRMDAHKLRGDYPAEKQEHSFTDLHTMTAVVREAMNEEHGSD